jgi:hypothetical protein
VTGEVTSGVEALIQTRLVESAEDFVAAARHFRAGSAERAMAALLPWDLAEVELPGRVLRMVAVGLLVIGAATGEPVDLGAFRSRVTDHDPEVLVPVMVHLVGVYAELERGACDE